MPVSQDRKELASFLGTPIDGELVPKETRHNPDTDLPANVRLHEQEVAGKARETRRGNRFRYVMENTHLHEETQDRWLTFDRNETLLFTLLIVAAISALAWSVLPLLGYFLAAAGALLDQKYGSDN